MSKKVSMNSTKHVKKNMFAELKPDKIAPRDESSPLHATMHDSAFGYKHAKTLPFEFVPPLRQTTQSSENEAMSEDKSLHENEDALQAEMMTAHDKTQSQHCKVKKVQFEQQEQPSQNGSKKSSAWIPKS